MNPFFNLIAEFVALADAAAIARSKRLTEK